MNDYLLMDSQKNEIYRLIKERGFNPGDFYFIQIKSTRIAKIIHLLLHKNSKYYFRFA